MNNVHDILIIYLGKNKYKKSKIKQNMKKYIVKFETAASADNYAIVDIPFTTSVDENPIQNLVCNKTGKHLKNDNGTVVVYPPDGPVIPNNEIHYTATEKITPYNTTVFGANYLPNESTFDETTHEGILKFDGNVTSIGGDAFSGRSGLTGITIPNSVTSIGEWAFSGCNSLTSVTIPNSVISIGNNAFIDGSYYSILNSITFESTTPISLVDQYSSIINIFGKPEYLVDFAIYVPSGYEETYATYDAGWEALAPFIVQPYTIFTYSDNTTSTSLDQTISQSSYNRNKTLTSVKIGTKATSIGNDAFSNCYNLTSVAIGNNVTSIGRSAFDSCYGLTSIELPNSVISIGEYAFSNSGLTSVMIPNSVTSIEFGAFYDCSSLTSVHISDLAAWCTISFSSNGANPLYYAHNLYLDDELITNLVIPDNVTTISNYAFCGCTGLTSIEIPNSVTSIGGSAFSYCNGLTFVSIPNSVTSIGNQAFENCTSLTSVTIPNSVINIGAIAFFLGNDHYNIIFESTIPNIPLTDSNNNIIEAFGGASSTSSVGNVTIIVPAGCRASYIAKDAGWEYYKAYIQEAQ